MVISPNITHYKICGIFTISNSHRAIFLDLQIDNIQRTEENIFHPHNLRSTHPFKAPKFIEIVVYQTNKQIEYIIKVKRIGQKGRKEHKSNEEECICPRVGND